MPEQPAFAAGAGIWMREVLHGGEWAHWRETVVSDDRADGGVLATLQPDGTPLVFPQDLAPTLASGRITQDELLAVLAAATDVADLLDRDVRWWAPWDDWTPADGRIGS